MKLTKQHFRKPQGKDASRVQLLCHFHRRVTAGIADLDDKHEPYIPAETPPRTMKCKLTCPICREDCPCHGQTLGGSSP